MAKIGNKLLKIIGVWKGAFRCVDLLAAIGRMKAVCPLSLKR